MRIIITRYDALLRNGFSDAPRPYCCYLSQKTSDMNEKRQDAERPKNTFPRRA